MKYILMMHGKKADWDAYVNWPKDDLLANVTFMHAFRRNSRRLECLWQPTAWRPPIKPRLFVQATTAILLRMESSPKPRSFSPDSGLSMWRTRSKRTGSLRGLRRHKSGGNDWKHAHRSEGNPGHRTQGVAVMESSAKDVGANGDPRTIAAGAAILALTASVTTLAVLTGLHAQPEV